MRRTNWWSPVVDGLAVLVGILTAFGIDAWWDVRQEKAVVAGHLASLAAELGESEAGFVRHAAMLEGQDDLIREILELAAGGTDAGGRLDSLVWVLGPYVPFEPSLPALGALEAVGLAAVDSDEVRTAVVRYQDVLAVDQQEQESYSEYWRDEISPYWDELFNIRRWLDYAGVSAEGDPEAGQFPQDLMAADLPNVALAVEEGRILADRRFLNQMSRRIIRSWRVRSRHVAVVDAGKMLRELIVAGLP